MKVLTAYEYCSMLVELKTTEIIVYRSDIRLHRTEYP